jgi:hypothetical protein
MALKGETATVVQMHREKLDRMAGDLVQAMWGPDGMPWGTKFAQLEDDAFELGQAIARRLVQRTVGTQATAQLPEKLQCCPKCGGQLGEADDEPRVLATRSGEVAWCEPQRTCPKCRRAFFPSGEEPGH